MGKAHPTSGRASIYQALDGKRDLRLTDFTTSNGPDVHVLLAQGTDQNLTKEFVKGELDSVELGSLKANQGDQNYDLPDSVDLAEIQFRGHLLRAISRCLWGGQAGTILTRSPKHRRISYKETK